MHFLHYTNGIFYFLPVFVAFIHFICYNNENLCKGVNFMLNKDNIKGFAIGFVASALLLCSATFAENVQKTITAFYNNIKIVVNGETITPKDANGNVVEPFIVDGTTYLPVRAISEALGEEVDWDGATSTVYIGEKPVAATPENTSFAVNAASLTPYKGTVLAKVNSQEISGDMVNFFLMQPEIPAIISSSSDYKSGDTLQTFKIEDKTAAEFFAQSALENIASTLNAAEQAAKQGLDKTPQNIEAIKSYEDQFFSQFADEASYKAFLNEYATTDAAIRTLLNKTALANIYFKELQSSLMSISNDALYKEYVNNFVHVKHILVPDKDTAYKIIAQLKSGANFDSLVEEHSIDPGQSSNGYIFTRGEMVPAFENEAFSMKINSYSSAPVESEHGYHILYRYPLTKDAFDNGIDGIRQSYAYNAYYSQIEQMNNANKLTFMDGYKKYIANIK